MVRRSLALLAIAVSAGVAVDSAEPHAGGAWWSKLNAELQIRRSGTVNVGARFTRGLIFDVSCRGRGGTRVRDHVVHRQHFRCWVKTLKVSPVNLQRTQRAYFFTLHPVTAAPAWRFVVTDLCQVSASCRR